MKKYIRKEMREMMEVRGYSQNTIISYISQVHYLAQYSGRAPLAVALIHLTDEFPFLFLV